MPRPLLPVDSTKIALKASAAACVVTLALPCGLDEFGCIVQLLQRRCYGVGRLGGIVLCLAPHGSGLGVGGMFADDPIHQQFMLIFCVSNFGRRALARLCEVRKENPQAFKHSNPQGI